MSGPRLDPKGRQTSVPAASSEPAGTAIGTAPRTGDAAPPAGAEEAKELAMSEVFIGMVLLLT